MAYRLTHHSLAPVSLNALERIVFAILLISWRLGWLSHSIELRIAYLGSFRKATLLATFTLFLFVHDLVYFVSYYELNLVLDKDIELLDDQMHDFLHSSSHLDVEPFINILKVFFDGGVPSFLLEERVIQTERYGLTHIVAIVLNRHFVLLLLYLLCINDN